MPRGQPWTDEDDALVRDAAAVNLEQGLTIPSYAGGRHKMLLANRFECVAIMTGRTVAAVRKRAQRLGARSYYRDR